MTNIFAFRATNPKVMLACKDPVGPENDKHLLEVREEAGLSVACWGNHGTHLNRGDNVWKMLKDLSCLTFTKAGQPGHPLYLPKSLLPIERFDFLDRREVGTGFAFKIAKEGK